MRSRILVAAVALAGLVAAPAHASVRTHYLHVYAQVKHRHGDRAPGRNIVRYGLRSGRRPSTERVRASIVVLDRMLAPVNVAPVASIATTSSPLATPVTSTAPAGGAGLPSCTWAPESGGSYTARNPTSGAGGKYQIIPSTWKAYGGSTDNAADATPAEQDAVAQRVMAGQGAGAWVNC